MTLSNITVNTQSSIRIEGSKILYFDPYQISNAAHDADLIFITHDHYDHFEPESIAKLRKAETLLVAPESMKRRHFPSRALPRKTVCSIDRGNPMRRAGSRLRQSRLTIS